MVTQRTETVSTKRLRIAELSRQRPDSVLTSLNGYVDEAWLESAYRRLKKGV